MENNNKKLRSIISVSEYYEHCFYVSGCFLLALSFIGIYVMGFSFFEQQVSQIGKTCLNFCCRSRGIEHCF